MIFYKIIDFKFNGKTYTAFRNTLGFKTYLEYNEDETHNRKYKYIDIDIYQNICAMFSKKKYCFFEDGKNLPKVRFIPKVITKLGLIVLTAATLSSPLGHVYAQDKTDTHLWPNRLFDNNEVILTEDYEVYEVTKTVDFLTTEGMELYWTDKENPDFADVRQAINTNKNINIDIKKKLLDFTNNLEIKYPKMNMTCFYHNCQNLNVVETSSQGMFNACGSETALACFVADDCQIYLNSEKINDDNYDYITYHEIGHMLLNGTKKIKKYTTRRRFVTADDAGFMLDEGFVTLLIEDVMGIKMDDVTYRLPANYCAILMDAIGYSFEDYVDGNHLEFEAKISSYLNDKTYNISNLPFLMEFQKYSVRKSSKALADDSEFFELYEIVSSVYFQKNLEYCDSKKDIINLYSNFISTILSEVYTKEGEYEFDFSGIKSGLYKTLKNNGIKKDIWPEENELETAFIVTTYQEYQPSRSR